jgi:hypothetical protein
MQDYCPSGSTTHLQKVWNYELCLPNSKQWADYKTNWQSASPCWLSKLCLDHSQLVSWWVSLNIPVTFPFTRYSWKVQCIFNRRIQSCLIEISFINWTQWWNSEIVSLKQDKHSNGSWYNTSFGTLMYFGAVVYGIFNRIYIYVNCWTKKWDWELLCYFHISDAIYDIRKSVLLLVLLPWNSSSWYNVLLTDKIF